MAPKHKAPESAGPSAITPEALARLEAATNEKYGGDEDSASDASIGLSSAAGDGSEYQSTRNGETMNSEEQASPKAISDQLSAKESKKVFRLRLMVSFVLIALGVAISGIVFKITTDGEVEEFKNHYENGAAKLIDTFTDIMNRMGSVGGLAVSFTSQGLHAPGSVDLDGHAASWPYVTMDDFPIKARNALQLSGALMVAISPIVTGDLFNDWNDYVVHPEQTQWINQSLAYQAHMPFLATHTDLSASPYAVNGSRPVDVMHYFNDWDVTEEVPGGPWYLPEWQTAPYIHHGLVNDNMLRNENTTRYVSTVIQDGTAVAGGFDIYEEGNMESPNEHTSFLATLRSAQAEEHRIYYGDPLSHLFVPVFDTFAAGKQKVVGVVNAMIHWKSYFNGVLLPTVPDLILVLEYKCQGPGGHGSASHESVATDEAKRRQRRMKTTTATTSKQQQTKENLEKDRDLAVTFTIIDVSDFEVTNDTDAPVADDGYWNMPPASATPAPVAGYWGVPDTTSTPAPVAGEANYWGMSPTTAPESGADLDVVSLTTEAPSAAGNNEYWQVAPPTTTAPAAASDPNEYWQVAPPTTTASTATSEPNTNDYWQATPPDTTTATPTVEASQSATSTTTQEKPAPEYLSGKSVEELLNSTAEFYGYENVAGTEEEASSVCFTIIVEGDEAHAVGSGDLHDRNFDDWMREGIFATSNLEDGTVNGVEMDSRCNYYIYVYPTQMFYDKYVTSTPIKITVAIVMVFIFAIVLFLVYNRLVEKRQRKVLQKATQSTALVASLFPKNVRDRLMQGGGRDVDGKELGLGNKSRLKGFMAGEAEGNDENAAPIADLFPHCTVFFGDISGFTAWSSTREPSQVFTLLQTVYQGFDQLAKRRRVFKVETIGDCYMAVTGLPDPQEAHASIMVRFAWDCVQKMREVTKRLESTLGPDTTDLSMRIGLHSGPVTAGVLRGDRARFQLFGDTVNTASRMESTGTRGKIQVSEATANLLRDVGRDHWIIPREDAVSAKGKGVLRTFWANPKNKRSNAGSSWEGSSEDQETGKQESVDSDDEEEAVDAVGNATALHSAQARLVDWIVRLMADDIRKMIAARSRHSVSAGSFMGGPTYQPEEGKTCMDEVKEVIHMPKFDAKKAHQTTDAKQIEIDPAVLRELGEYVTGIALLYRRNPFHNFEHACHVTMSVSKLIRRIVSPEISTGTDGLDDKAKRAALHSNLHDHTYGINSDPLAMFAMTFSALIHDVDHRGCSNQQLAQEAPAMATLYHNKSLAEQNSLDLAWDLLMEKRFSGLRQCLFATKDELLRFRQLIVNIVLATDIFDKELNDLRKNRWRRAFAGEVELEDIQKSDLRATIVLEHIIQASDVSHTMQHWHVYQKWNRCLFKEMHAAFKAGRLAKDPSTFWYKGEMGFFDNYIIPLAGKLKECGVFGVSSDEYLNYAKQNRAEWEERGEDIVAKMQEEANEDDLGEADANVRSAIKRLTGPETSMVADAQTIRDTLRSSLQNSSKSPPTPEEALALKNSLRSSLKKEGAP